ncbi:MAG: hypothetical protein OXM55_07860 [Bdellovibrionales bacterium]|nr:hypothetical protein [Bdellovibrionales bacterium]
MNIENGITVYGKWILAGEYAVLRSYPALVFPLPTYFIKLHYQRTSINNLKIVEEQNPLTQFSTHRNFASFFSSVLDQALQNIAKSCDPLKGVIRLHPQIPFAAGIGSSAVVCALIGKLFYYLNWLKEEDLFPFCHQLENSLHGLSSGVDIAAVLTGKPILYRWMGANAVDNFHQRNKATQFKTIIEEFNPVWKPLIFLSHCNQSSSTKVNVKKVQRFWKKEPEKADKLNRQMEKAVLKAKEGLKEKNKEKGLTLLKKSFSLSEDCFIKWGLINENMREHIQFLKKQGALATKPTGSGAGGCVLSLWSQLPPAHLRNQLTFGFL